MGDMCGTVLHTPAERSVVAHGNGTRIERSRCNDTRYPDHSAIRSISQNGTLNAPRRTDAKARLQNAKARQFLNLRGSRVVDMVKSPPPPKAPARQALLEVLL
jgi:hypothetical protein